MTGELNLTKCGNEVRINNGPDVTDIKIGDSLWLILNKNQVRALKENLDREGK